METPDISPSLGKSITIAAGIMAASNLVSRLLGYGRVMVLANYAGTGHEADAYVFSFLIPDVVNHLLAGSALSIPFIPLFQKYLIEERRDKAWRFFSNIMTVGSIGFVLLIVFSMVYTERLIGLFGPNINDPANQEKFHLTVRLTRIILPAQLFFFWGALLNGVQYAHKRFLLPAFAPLVYNLGIIIGGIALSPIMRVEGFSWGVLAGAFVGNVLVQIPGVIRVGIRYRPTFKPWDADCIAFVLITLPFIVGLTMNFSNEFFLRTFGSFVHDGGGALASLDYGYRTMFFLVGIFGQGVAAGFYPFLSQLTLEKKFTEIKRLLVSSFSKIGAVLIPFSGIMFIVSRPIITLLLQRGQFDETSTQSTAATFQMYLPGAFFAAAALIIQRAFYAMKNTWLPLLVNGP